MPESKLAGQANVFIFPSLNAANIGFKIAQHLAGYTATGPFIQGLQKSMGLLSAQSTTEEIIRTALMASCLV
jgi:phosphotransacetylase